MTDELKEQPTQQGAVAVVTGGTAGLGLALTRALVASGWTVVVDGRRRGPLAEVADALGRGVRIVPGDVADAAHRANLAAAVRRLGRLDLLVHGASTLGPLPMRTLREVSVEEADETWAVNAAAPLAITRLLLPALVEHDGVLVSISSDAAVEHYGTWGVYAATKAALDSLTLTIGAEEGLAAYAVDPGDMRTAMHQDAFPDDDISDRPLPESVVPHLLGLLEARPPNGRYRATDLPVASAPEAVAS